MSNFSLKSGISSDIPTSLLDAATDELMEQLLLLESAGCGIHSSAVSVNLETRLIEVEVGVNAETLSEAKRVANACVRAAIHALGGVTPGWGEEAVQSVSPELVSSR
jgi:hypothetical protein